MVIIMTSVYELYKQGLEQDYKLRAAKKLIKDSRRSIDDIGRDVRREIVEHASSELFFSNLEHNVGNHYLLLWRAGASNDDYLALLEKEIIRLPDERHIQ